MLKFPLRSLQPFRFPDVQTARCCWLWYATLPTERFCHQCIFHKTSPWYCSDFFASPGVCFALVTLTIPSTHSKWRSDYLQTKALKDEARIAGIHKNTQNASRRVHLFKNNQAHKKIDLAECSVLALSAILRMIASIPSSKRHDRQQFELEKSFPFTIAFAGRGTNTINFSPAHLHLAKITLGQGKHWTKKRGQGTFPATKKQPQIEQKSWHHPYPDRPRRWENHLPGCKQRLHAWHESLPHSWVDVALLNSHRRSLENPTF